MESNIAVLEAIGLFTFRMGQAKRADFIGASYSQALRRLTIKFHNYTHYKTFSSDQECIAFLTNPASVESQDL